MFSTVCKSTATVAVVGVAIAGSARAEEALECTTFEELYEDGVQLCEDMWDAAFEVVDDEDGYTMWFFSDDNPNDVISDDAGLEGADDRCYLADYYHKEAPGDEPLQGECTPFSDNACCKSDTVPTTEALLNIYGAKYRPDRCGPLTRQCERFFVQEACFYECDANSGYWRKYAEEGMPSVGNASDPGRIRYEPKCNPSDPKAYSDIGEDGVSPSGTEFVASNPTLCGEYGHNQWQLYKMPIKRSYCNAWYNACRKDKFCGVKDGSFFECGRIPPPPPEKVVETLTPGGAAGIAVASILAVLAIAVIGFIVWRERSGRPLFKSLPESDDNEME